MKGKTLRAPTLLPQRGLDLYTLKLIAIVAMTFDHAATAFVPDMTPAGLFLHIIGRITGPVMFFAAVEGYHHTRSLPRYLLRLGLFAVLSWFPFVYFLCGGDLAAAQFLRFDVIYTIFMGVLAVHIRHSRLPIPCKALLILLLVVLCVPADWDWTPIFMMLVFDFFRGDFQKLAFAYSLVVLYDLGLLTVLVTPFRQLLYNGAFTMPLQSYYVSLVGVGAYLPLALLAHYNGEYAPAAGGGRTWARKWLFYCYYPLHLLALGFLQKIL